MAVGETSYAHLEARDAFGNARGAGGDTWVVELDGPIGVEPATHAVHDRADGTYELALCCRVAGEHTARVGLQVHASAPRTRTAGAGAAAAVAEVHWLPHPPLQLLATPQALTTECTLVWPRPANVVAGEAIELRLRATDPWGNPVGSLGGATAVLERLSPGRVEPLTLVQPRSPLGRFHHRDARGPTAAHGAVDSAAHHVADEDDEDELASRWVACELHRGGLVAAAGYYGAAANANAANANADDTYFDGGVGDGRRAAGWSELLLRSHPTRVGLYMPVVTLHGQAFRPPTAEYAVHVGAGPPAAQRSHASGSALRGGEVGRVSRFRVAVCDAYGNLLRGCASAVRATVRHATRDATVAATLAARGGSVVVGGALAGGTAALQPGSPATHVASCLSALTSWQAVRRTDEAASMAAAADDDDDDDDGGDGGDAVCVVTIDDAEEDEEEATAGWARATFVPRRAGTHVLRVYVGGLEISGSPFSAVFIAGAMHPSHCTARGDGLRGATAGVAAIVELQAYDGNGNVLRRGDGGSGAFVAALRRADGTVVDCASRCFDRGDGSSRLGYTTFTSGALQLELSCRGLHVKGSPFAVNVAPGRAHAPHCRIVGAGAIYARLAPTVATFSVLCHDRWHNRCVGGGERIVARAAGPTPPIVSVLDLCDGSYQVCCRYSLSGVYQLTVGLGSRPEERVPLPGSPFTVYAGLQLAEQYLLRWLDDEAPQAKSARSALAADRWAAAADGSTLAVGRLGAWRHDRDALLAHSMRAWKHFVGRRLLDRMVAGAVPPGSPRVATYKGAPLPPRQHHHHHAHLHPQPRHPLLSATSTAARPRASRHPGGVPAHASTPTRAAAQSVMCER